MTEAVETNEQEKGIFIPFPVLYKLTNDVESPELDHLLSMFYEGVYYNRVGVMKAWNLATEQEELVLFGVDFTPEGQIDMSNIFPIAKVLAAEDVPNYLSPNGQGGFFDPRDPVEAAAVQETLRPADESTEEIPGAEVVVH